MLCIAYQNLSQMIFRCLRVVHYHSCFEIANISGCVFITVEALNSSVGWYENLGFITREKNTDKYRTMVLMVLQLNDLL